MFHVKHIDLLSCENGRLRSDYGRDWSATSEFTSVRKWVVIMMEGRLGRNPALAGSGSAALEYDHLK